MNLRFHRFPAKWAIIVALILLGTGSILVARATSGPSNLWLLPTPATVPTSIYDFELTGVTHFPNVYTGGVQESDGSVTFYVTRRDPALLSAIAAADSNRTPYRFVIVPDSYAETNAVTMAIAAQNDALRADGVFLVSWGPDPRTGTVVVNLAKPTDHDLAKLADTIHVPLSSVTVDNYPAQAQALLRAQFGNFVWVDPTYQEPAQAD
jgi:hypothetical protein